MRNGRLRSDIETWRHRIPQERPAWMWESAHRVAVCRVHGNPTFATFSQIAEALGISTPRASADWQTAIAQVVSFEDGTWQRVQDMKKQLASMGAPAQSFIGDAVLPVCRDGELVLWELQR